MKHFYVPDIRELLDTGAEKFGNKTFIRYLEDGEIIDKSYNDVRSDALAICRYLRRECGEGKHIALVGKTSYRYVTYLFGILISGNVVVPFAPETSSADGISLFSSADIDVLMYEDNFYGRAIDICNSVSGIKQSINITDEDDYEDILAVYSDNSEYAKLSDYKVDKEKCAAIIYTSGTTGVRKGVMLSTKSLVANTMYTDYCEALGEGEVALSVLPMHHVYCFTGDIIRNLRDGVTVCLNGDLRNLNANIRLFEPTVMRVVPMIAQSLLQRAKALSSRNPNLTPEEVRVRVFGKNLRWLISGGAYLNPEIVEGYDKLGIYLRQGYGMTEAGCRISVPDERVSTESVGRVIDIADVRCRHGEIQVLTPSVMMGYYEMPEETKRMFTEDGWLRTGDIGSITERRELFITGRLKNLIILSGGENVSPEAIEKKFAAIPEVQEVQIYAENDRIVAEIYGDRGYCEANGIEDIRSTLEPKVKEMNLSAKASHIITELRIRDVPFEKTASGKIIRKRVNVS